MKKLRVILPAILTLAVSTSAAVTGTVAWFTATRLRTVKMEKITVVNPEEGLNLVKVTNIANTKLDNVDNQGKPTYPNGAAPKITHANVNTTQGYLRDASVDVENDTVYKAQLADDGTISGFTAQDIATKDTKKFNDKDIYYATAFTLDFNIDRVDDGVDTCLFFDPKASFTSALSAVEDGENKNYAYKALRIGMICGDEWFVWAPLTGDTEAATDLEANPKKYAVRYVTENNSHELVETDLPAANKIVGEEGEHTTDSKYNESGDKNAIAHSNVDNVEYLGILKKASNLTVKVFTWFEGSDSACVNDNFQTVVDAMEVNLKFISRRVLKA